MVVSTLHFILSFLWVSVYCQLHVEHQPFYGLPLLDQLVTLCLYLEEVPVF